jgi:copper chaperone CopZ
MRRFAALVLFALGISAAPLWAGDAATPNQYISAISGIVCQECKAKVTYAVKKLPGVTEVTFAKGDKPGEQKVTFASTSGALEKKDVVQALGDAASEFQVLSLDKVKP